MKLDDSPSWVADEQLSRQSFLWLYPKRTCREVTNTLGRIYTYTVQLLGATEIDVKHKVVTRKN